VYLLLKSPLCKYRYRIDLCHAFCENQRKLHALVTRFVVTSFSRRSTSSFHSRPIHAYLPSYSYFAKNANKSFLTCGSRMHKVSPLAQYTTSPQKNLVNFKLKPKTRTEIGVALTTFGGLFMLLGVILFFDGALLALGNVRVHMSPLEQTIYSWSTQYVNPNQY
jgi:hypothetical protein